MIDAGELDNRVDIQKFVRAKGADGATTKTYRTIVQVWASIESIKGKEIATHQQTDARATHMIIIRFLDFLTPEHRIKHKNDTYEITFIDNVENRDFEYKILAIRDA